MIVIPIILCIVILYLLYVLHKENEKFDNISANKVVPLNDTEIKNNAEVPNDGRDRTDLCEDSKIEKYRNNFFSFNNRINHNTHLSDPVDKINLMDSNIGRNIGDIYDELVGVDNYKTHDKNLNLENDI